MKVVQDKHIDYIAGNYGVRVWRHMCRSITMENGRWIEYGAEFPLPVAKEFIELPSRNSNSVTSLACNVVRYEEIASKGTAELRKLLLGQLSFDDVVSYAMQRSETA